MGLLKRLSRPQGEGLGSLKWRSCLVKWRSCLVKRRSLFNRITQYWILTSDLAVLPHTKTKPANKILDLPCQSIYLK